MVWLHFLTEKAAKPVFYKVALVKARVLRVQIAPRCSLFASLLLAPLSRVLPRSSLASALLVLPTARLFCVVFVLSLVLGVLLFLRWPGVAKASPQDAGNVSDDTLEFPRDFR